MIALIADALAVVVAELEPAVRDHAAETLDWLRVVAVPPEGLVVASADGARFTGIAVLEANRIVALIAARAEPGAASTPPPAVTVTPFVRRSFDPDEVDDDGYFHRR